MTQLIYPELSYLVQGGFYEAYNELNGLDLAEEGWERALVIVLKERGVTAERQVEYELRYKGHRIGRFFVDVVVDSRLLLELKVVEKLTPLHLAQILSYLKVTGFKLGILINFGGDILEFRRIPNFIAAPSVSHPEQIAIPPGFPWLYPELTGEIRNALYEVHSELGLAFFIGTIAGPRKSNCASATLLIHSRPKSQFNSATTPSKPVTVGCWLWIIRCSWRQSR